MSNDNQQAGSSKNNEVPVAQEAKNQVYLHTEPESKDASRIQVSPTQKTIGLFKAAVFEMGRRFATLQCVF